MARIPIFPKPGIYRGATPNASAGRWYDANLMRWRGGQAQPVGGNAALLGALLDGPGRDLITWHNNDGERLAAIGTDNKLFVYCFDDASLYDITPSGVGPLEPPGARVGYGLGDYGAGAYGTARDPSDIGPSDSSAIPGDMWSMDLFGEDLMVVPTQDGGLYRWSPQTESTPAAPVPNAPIKNAGVVVTDERHVVLIGAGGNARAVAWSDQEDPETWTATVTNMAGDQQLETEGRPFNALRVTSGVLILTDNDAHLMKYVGPPYAYGINKIGSNCGPISRRGISQAGGVTVWMGAQTFWNYTGSVVPLPSEVGDWMFSLINRDMVGRVFGAANPAFTEHWFFWPDEGASDCTRYVAVNYGDPSFPWIIGRMTRTAADYKGALARPVLAGPDNKLYLHEYGWLDDGASRVGQIYLETGDFSPDDNADRRFHVTQIAQDFAGPAATVGYRFFLWEQPDGPEWDTGSIPILNDTGLTDARFSARGCRMRIEALADGPFAIGRTRLEVKPGGSR